MGQNVVYSNVGMTVNSVTKVDEIGDFFKPAPGNVYVIVSVSIQNKRPYQIPYEPYQFTLTDASGTVYQAGVTAGPQPLQRSTLDATKDVTGNVNFEVPGDAQGLVLAYQVPGATQSITVQIGDAAQVPTPAPTPVPTVAPTSTPAPESGSGGEQAP